MNTPTRKTKISIPKRGNAITSPSLAKVILQKRNKYSSEEIDPRNDKDVMSWIECLFDDECALHNRDLFAAAPKKRKLGLFGSPTLYRDDDTDSENTAVKKRKKKATDNDKKVTKKRKEKPSAVNAERNEPKKKRRRRTKSKSKEPPSSMKKNKSSKASTFKSSRNKIPIRNKTELSLMKCLFGENKSKTNKSKEKNSVADTTIKKENENMEEMLQKAAIAKRKSDEKPSEPKKQQVEESYNTSKTPLLTKEEEIELSNLIQQGIKLQTIKSQYETAHDQIITNEEWATISNLDVHTLEEQLKASTDAKNKLITSNLGLVYSTIRNGNYQKNGISEEELVQEGCLGLIRASELFDPTKGYRFSTYATIWIKGTLGNSRIDQTISIPEKEKRKWRKIQKAVQSLSPNTQVITKIENVQVIAEMVDMSAEDVQRITNQMNNMKRILSLDYKYTTTSRSGATESEEFSLEHKQKSDDLHEVYTLRHDISRALTTLSKREEQILKLRYGLTDDLKCRSIVECAREMGMSRGRVQQLAAEGLKKLREKEDVRLLQEYLAQI